MNHTDNLLNTMLSENLFSYSTTVYVGYSLQPTVFCYNFVDINECTESPSVCHQNANCTNTNGSYSCQCLTGYNGDGNLDCAGTVIYIAQLFYCCVSNANI